MASESTVPMDKALVHIHENWVSRSVGEMVLHMSVDSDRLVRTLDAMLSKPRIADEVEGDPCNMGLRRRALSDAFDVCCVHGLKSCAGWICSV